MVDDKDWDLIWERLLKASMFIARSSDIFGDDRLYFDFGTLAKRTRALQEHVNQVYSLMCGAPKLPGLVVERGEDLRTLRREVDIRRAEIVEADLATVRHQPAPDATIWRIKYDDDGGFVATDPTGSGQRPFRFWGFASTPRSAAVTIAGYFLDHPPTITFDPPLPSKPRPLATLTDRTSPDGPRVTELLDARGPIYDEHITACARVRDELAGRDLAALLTDRAALLNTTDPQLSHGHASAMDDLGSDLGPDHVGLAGTVHRVPTPLVVATGRTQWGEFGDHRPHIPLLITTALASADDLDAFTRDLFTNPINLIRVPAWAGPVYRLGANGTHRIHIARMLDIPWVAASIDFVALPTSRTMLDLLSTDISSRTGTLEHRARQRLALIEGLIHRGIIDADLTTAPATT